jgi:gamma-glutamylaminecyclotransferase
MQGIFVYGTLKRGGSNHRFLAGQSLVGNARTLPEFRLFELNGYPGMVRVGSGGRSIEGEIWSVDADCVAALDELEGVGEGLYERIAITLLPPFAEISVETYLYLQSTAGRPELESWPR